MSLLYQQCIYSCVCVCVCVFQSWDLVEQTQNYLKLLLHIINSDGRLCL